MNIFYSKPGEISISDNMAFSTYLSQPAIRKLKGAVKRTDAQSLTIPENTTPFGVQALPLTTFVALINIAAETAINMAFFHRSTTVTIVITGA